VSLQPASGNIRKKEERKGIKPSHEDIVKADYTKYGLITGKLTTSYSLNCSVILEGWLGWLLAATLHGWQVKVIVLKDTRWLKQIECSWPCAVVLEYEECYKWWTLGLEIEVQLSDVDPPRKLSLFECTYCNTVITCQRARLNPKGWDWEMWEGVHTICGGATNGGWRFHFYRRQGLPPTNALSHLVGTDMPCHLDTNLQGLPCA